ncbi:33 kDa chaperonin [Caldalkalibacillus thermarum TA2.A1]|uniref:33 kDa chaperonin n=1 Tax=Caldalkalibacillus thermarum (strain TA2.A1) TaxID=986075 RepID=F5LA13_CALTT|nr:Hsp33 family molecular chaperone HslO [Caldalkalibacillus thermarum]EGL81883.1 33 kDa chaperonin [Caldalkalibacillus thermarum TA2.A1]QZT34369.1 Hsp33 family molecular chaperone HslO [Caldalkalibacillus thermarum TA2.A1]
MSSQQDYLVKALVLEGKVRVYAVRSTQVAEECRRRQDTWPTATAALGRTLSVGAMMGAMLKGEEKLTIRVAGDGPIGRIIVDANGKGEVRGFVSNPHVDLPLNDQGKLDVGGAVGAQGYLYVTRDLGLKEPYQGSSPLVSGEIGEDFTYYFAQSEQTPSAVAVGVLVNPDHSVKASGGYIIQLLPGVDDQFISQLEKRLTEIPPVSHMVDQGYTPEQMIETLFPAAQIKWLERLPIRFSCNCSKERVKEVLASLGVQELEKMLAEQGQAEVNCHFCRETYEVSKDELTQLIADQKD